MILSQIISNSQPNIVLLTKDGKVCILSKIKLIVSKIDKFWQFYQIALKYPNPTQCAYSCQSKQIIVVSQNSVQIYDCCDLNELSLKNIIILNKQNIWCLEFENIWHIYGNIYQYNPKRVRFHFVQQTKKQSSLASCFTGCYQIFIQKDCKLYIRNHRKNVITEIKWNQRLMVIKNIEKISLKSIRISANWDDTNRKNDACFIVQISQKFGLIIINKKATTFQFQKILLVEHGFLIGMTKQKMMKIIKVQNSKIIDLGLIQPYQGKLFSAIQIEETICLAVYNEQELNIKKISILNCLTPDKQKKQTLQINHFRPSTILQQENQSQLKQLTEQKIDTNEQNNKQQRQEIKLKQVQQFSIQNFQKTELITHNERQSNQKSFQKIADQLKQHIETPLIVQKQIEKQKSQHQQKIIPSVGQSYSNFQLPSVQNSYFSERMFTKSQQTDQNHLQKQLQIKKYANPQLRQQQSVEQIDTEEITIEDLRNDFSNKVSKQSDLQRKFKIGDDISQIKHYNSPATESDPSVDEKQQNFGNQEQEETIQLKKQMENIDGEQENCDFSQQKNKKYPIQILKYLQDQSNSEFNSEQHTPYTHSAPYTPYTPAFGGDIQKYGNNHQFLKHPEIQIRHNDEWSSLANKWTNVQESSIDKQNRQNYISSSNLGQKVYNFCNDPKHVSEDQINNIQKKKYISLMKELYNKSEEKFNQCLKIFLQQIIKEQEARLFFADYIRTFSEEQTKDTLIRLYSVIQDNEQNKCNMSKALSQFKLSQVPQKCLPLDKQLIKIYQILYPTIYLQDLLNPTIKIFELLLQNYFKQKNLQSEVIQIQDEIINITHPRNILNVILYLNDFYGFEMQDVFSIYCTQLIKNQCYQIVQKMSQEQETFDICGVNPDILNQIIQNNAIQMLKQSFTNIEYVQKTIHILKGQKKRQLLLILNAIDYLNFRDIFFSIDQIFKLKFNSQIFNFLKNVIQENAAANLLKIKICQLYKNLFFICKEELLTCYNFELTQICQIFAEKLIANTFTKAGFQILLPILKNITRGFLSKLLLKYFDGKLLNRLANKFFVKGLQFVTLFPQLFKNEKCELENVNRDELSISNKSQFLLCKWTQFSLIYDSTISCPSQQIKFICYKDFPLADQISSYNFIQKKQWKDFNQKIKKYLPLDYIIKGSGKQKTLFQTRIMIQSQQQSPPQTISGNKQTSLNVIQNSQKFNTRIKSLKNIQLDDLSKSNLSDHKKAVQRSKSDERVEQVKNLDPLIQSLKIQVEKESIIQTLKQIYEESVPNFIKALSVIDRQRAEIFHYQTFKYIINLNLDFQICSILLFEVFTIQNHDKCHQMCLNLIWSKINLKNGLVICLLMEIMFKKGKQTSFLLLKKIIEQNKNEALKQVIQRIVLRFNYNEQYILKTCDLCSKNSQLRDLSVPSAFRLLFDKYSTQDINENKRDQMN